MTITSSSSGTIIPFVQKFEAWRKSWHRQVLADPQVGLGSKAVAGLMVWHLNRESRGCFLLYKTITTGTAISRRYAMQGVKELVEHGHLRRDSRAGKSNHYFPIVSDLGGEQFSTPGVNNSAPLGVSVCSPITSKYLTSESNRSRNGGGAPKIQEGAGETCPPLLPSETIPPGAKKNGSAVGFDGQVVRPSAEQVRLWRRDYSAIPDIRAELRTIDDWCVRHSYGGDWVTLASRWLGKEHTKRFAAKQAEDDDSF